MKKKIIIITLTILFIFILRQYFPYEQLLDTQNNNNPTNIQTQPSYLQENGSIQLYFCPHENCEQAFVDFLNSANNSIHCALYDIGLSSVQQTLEEKSKTIDVKIVTDNDYLKKFNKSYVKTDTSGLMHNKFCIIDNTKISTGSMNPTDNDAHKNNNNLLLIDSTLLAQNYEQEFQEMWNKTFKKGNQNINTKIMLNHIKIENYFCPEDHCAKHVAEQLSLAKESIYFMTFSFTNQEIGNQLLLQNLNNLTIKGIMEVKQIDKDSVYQQLLTNNISVIKDQNKYNLHHKVFIIDQETVITGSFNPTGNGNKNNDENIIIIHDKEITQKFLNEFKILWINWSNQSFEDPDTTKNEIENNLNIETNQEIY